MPLLDIAQLGANKTRIPTPPRARIVVIHDEDLKRGQKFNSLQFAHERGDLPRGTNLADFGVWG